VPPKKRTFYVAFPGYDMLDVPKTRNDGIKNAQNKKIMHQNFPPAITPSDIPPTVTESAPVNMPPPESKPPKKAASKSASIKNSKFVDDSLKEIIRPGKVTRSKKEQIEKPQSSPEIKVIANPN
jgi:hypothetical protein